MKKCPPKYRHLSGLLHVFKSKIGRVISPVLISARFTYILSDWGSRGAWPEEPIDPDIVAQTLDKLQFGCLDDPVSDLHLSAVWPSVYENMVAENDVHSDFNPLIAPVWTVKVVYTDNPECLLSSYLRDMLKLITSTDTFSSLIKTTLKDDEQDMGQALSRLTDSSHKVKQMVPLMPELTMGITKIVTTPTSVWASRMKSSSHTTTGPMSQPMLELVMDFLFSEKKSGLDTEIENEAEEKIDLSKKLEFQLKSAPQESLTYRLATCLSVMNYCHGGITAIAQVWHEFIQEMRYRFENGIPIVGISSDNPDLRCCMLHQKLQMLNCCILHKNARECKQNESFDADLDENVNQSEIIKVDPTESDLRNVESSTEFGGNQAVKIATSSGGDGKDRCEDSNNASQQANVIEQDMENGLLPTTEPETHTSAIDQPEPTDSTTVLDRKDSAPSQKSNVWRDEVSSIEDEFFDCDDGDVVEDEMKIEAAVFTKWPNQPGDIAEEDPTSDEKAEEAASDNVSQNIDLDAPTTTESDKSESKSISPDTTEATLSKVDIPSDHTAKPEGRLERFENANLLNFNTPLYIPVTQEPAPITEDILEEQTKIFSSLGDSVEGASLRRRMQSASLLSDMESFKSANPGCVLLDFVRWYSPRDYEIVDGKGLLSERMKLPGNLWQTMWNTAKSVPARRQKRLFDDTKEGEKVLHYLSSLQPKDLALYLLPICFHEAISILEREKTQDLPSLTRLCNQILSQSCKLFRGNFAENYGQLEDILQKIQFTETLIARVMSLKHKFQTVAEIDNFVRNVVENPEVALENAASGELGNVIKQYFLDQATAKFRYSAENETLVKAPSFPTPIGKEYILRTTAPKPSSQSRTLPHRMYAVLVNGEFRLAGAFSSDTVFF